MKKIFIGILAALLVTVFISSSAPASASPSPDYYTPAKEGDLLHELNFSGDNYWKPTAYIGNFGYTPLSASSAEIIGHNNSAQNWYGGELEGLPIDNAGYTITMTIIRNEKACFGLYVDGKYGCYGYAEQLHLMDGPSALTSADAHPYVKLGSLGYDFPNVAADGSALNDGSLQEYAMEVDGFTYNLRFYVKDTSGEWRLVDQSYDGEILVFTTYNLGLYFYSYYTQKATIGDLKIYKGYTVSGEPLQSADEVTTKAPVTTAKVTTKAPGTTKVPDEVGDGLTTTPDTTGKPADTSGTDKKPGCASLTSSGVAVFVMTVGAAQLIRRKKR